MMHQYRILDRSYAQDILLIICSREEIKDHLLKTYNVEDEHTYKSGAYIQFEYTEKNKRSKYQGTWMRNIIWMPQFEFITTEYGTLAHEVLHLTFKVLDDLGFKHTSESEEAYTYYMGWVYEGCLKALFDQYEKDKKEKEGA